MEALVLAGVKIRKRGNLVCLTDMWRLAGGDTSKRPAKWLAQDGPEGFVRHVADNLDIPVRDIAISERGGPDAGATWAHWQISIYYAKSLSHELHMECNKVIRAHYEGQQPGGLSGHIETRLTAVEHRVDQHDEKFRQHEKVLVETYQYARETHGNVIKVVQWQEKARLPKPRRFSEEVERICYLVIHLGFNGLCLIDRATRLTDDEGKRLPGVSELDHWHGPQYNRIENAFPATNEVHQKLTAEPNFREANLSAFQYFHKVRKELEAQGAFIRPKKLPKPRQKGTVDNPKQKRWDF